MAKYTLGSTSSPASSYEIGSSVARRSRKAAGSGDNGNGVAGSDNPAGSAVVNGDSRDGRESRKLPRRDPRLVERRRASIATFIKHAELAGQHMNYNPLESTLLVW